ncbi:ribosomal prt L8, partial [Hepatospora eriocheir]
MSKVIRRLRNIKIKSRRKSKADSKIIEPSYPRSNGIQEMKCVKLIHQRGKGCPLAEMNSNDKVFHVIATEGMSVGKIYTMGNEKKPNPGNILKLKNVPEGSYVHSLEYVFNDGGKVAMTAGSKCTIENHRREENETVIKLPSGVKRVFSSEVKCIVGVCASAG